MNKLSFLCLLVFLLAGCATQNIAQNTKKEMDTPKETAKKSLPSTKYTPVDWRHYNHNPSFKPTTLPNGTVANIEALKVAGPVSRAVRPRGVMPVMDKVWVITGWFYAPVIIETEEGLIVVSSGEHEGEGKIFRQLIRDNISTKPIIAVMMDHAHYSKGTMALLDGDKAMIVAHTDHNEIFRIAGELSNPSIPEMLPVLDAKAKIHFSTNHPKTGKDAPLAGSGGTLELGQERGWIPATKTLGHGETITIGGVKIQGFHATTDTEETLTFWLPEKELIIDNVMWAMIPNLYTLRGDKYRSPLLWMEAIRQIRDLKPKVLIDIGGGGLPLNGEQTIEEACNALYDIIAYIYDQSIRLTNMGVHPKELRHYIKIPTSLTGHPYVNEIYGEVNTFFEAFPTYNGGWFSGYAEDIHTLPKKVKADNYIALAGGTEKIMTAYRAAMEKGEYLWAKELATNLYYSDKGNASYRTVLADVFRKLGQYTPSIIVRNFYTAGALSLEGDEKFSLNSIQSESWVTDDISRAVNHLRTRINPSVADGTNGVLSFKIGDVHIGLHIRNAVAEFLPNPTQHYQPIDATIEVSPKQFAAYFRGAINAESLIENGKITGDAAKLLKVFDKYQPTVLYPAEELLKMN